MKHKTGFTLIELLIYITILGLVLIVITGFFWNIALGYVKENSYQELQQNGRFVLAKISQEIRRAKNVTNPGIGLSSNFLSLEMPDSNQLIFLVDNGKLIMTKNGTDSILTTDRTVVELLEFNNMSYENTPGIVRIKIALSHANPGGMTAYQSDINLITTVSLLH